MPKISADSRRQAQLPYATKTFFPHPFITSPVVLLISWKCNTRHKHFPSTWSHDCNDHIAGIHRINPCSRKIFFIMWQGFRVSETEKAAQIYSFNLKTKLFVTPRALCKHYSVWQQKPFSTNLVPGFVSLKHTLPLLQARVFYHTLALMLFRWYSSSSLMYPLLHLFTKRLQVVAS